MTDINDVAEAIKGFLQNKEYKLFAVDGAPIIISPLWSGPNGSSNKLLDTIEVFVNQQATIRAPSLLLNIEDYKVSVISQTLGSTEITISTPEGVIPLAIERW